MNFATIAFTLLLAVQAAANPFVAQSKNSAEAEYISKLLAAAKPTSNSQLPRDLAQNQNNFDLTGYMVKYDRCQFVMSYDDDEAASSSSTVLGTSHFVIFRLCPTTGTCNSCTSNYGEYLVDLDQYLSYTVAFQTENQTTTCNYCDACTDQTTSGSEYVDCSICTDECSKITNMEANGYIDATTFATCTLIYDPNDDTKGSLYAGVMCASSGGKIKIGVFTDANCVNYDSTKNVDNFIVDKDSNSMKLSYALLKTVYDSTLCISCDNNGATSEMCASLYNDAAKCEVSHGFTTGIASVEGYENQAAQEELVCSYISSLTAGTYSESGEILVSGASKTVSSKSSTGGQKFALTFFILGTVALAGCAVMLHQKLTKGGNSALANQGGALA